MDKIIDLTSEIYNTLDNDELIVDNDKDIDLSTEYSCLIFKRDDLVRVINLCNKLILVKSDISEYNSISFMKSTRTICMYATNELSHFIFESELIGDLSNSIEESFCISVNILQKIVKLMGNKVLIYKKDNKFYIRLLDGDLLIDVRPSNKDIIYMPGNIKDKIAELSLSNFGDLCTSILPLISSETRGDSKRLYFTGDKVYFKSPFYYIEGEIKTPQIVLSYRDVEFISKIYKYYKDSQIQLFNVNTSLPRIRIKLKNIDYQFINSKGSDINLVTQEMSNIIKEPEISVPFDKLYRVISLATALPGIDNIITMKYNSNQLHLSIINNKGNSDFNISVEKLNTGRMFGKEIIINANILKRLLMSFSNYDKIDIALDDLGVTIKAGYVKAFLMNYGN